MPNQACCVGPCENRSWMPDQLVIRGHVKKLVFHSFPKNEDLRKIWDKQISKGLKNYEERRGSYVCSNHFKLGKPAGQFNYPTLYLTKSDAETKTTPVKRNPQKRTKSPYDETGLRQSPRKRAATAAAPTEGSVECTDEANKQREETLTMDEFLVSLGPEFQIQQVARDAKVQYYTGFEGAGMFKLIFEHLLPIAKRMQYWKGKTETQREERKGVDLGYEELLYERGLTRKRPGPARSLPLEQEFLMVMMRLRADLKVQDLSYRFKISLGSVTSILFTWIRLMSLELRCLIKWPERTAVRRYMPDGFRKYYPKCRVIIDCTEVPIETPSSLDLAASCWSQYKHHHTIKYLVGITPNGAISFLSDCWGGRASDISITEDCGLAEKLLPNDQVMADRGFKIGEYLAYYQCSLTIPPSTQGNLQMRKDDVKQTSKVANLRIFVEKAIRRMKEYAILKTELPLLLLPICDDIVTICAAMTNLKAPLLEQ